jgi:beta-N-acetylhexosaminidase
VDNQKLIAEMQALKLPGIRFEALDVPVTGERLKYTGETIKAVRFHITDRNSYRPLETSLLMIEKIRHMHPDKFEWRGTNPLTIERHGGTKNLKEAIDNGTVAALLATWKRDQSQFKTVRSKYLLY